MIEALHFENYRSLRQLRLPLQSLNVVTGGNGSGKSNVYRALRLLASSVQGGVVPALAAEGGLASVFWAGPEQITAAMRRGEQPVQGQVRSQAKRLILGFSAAGESGLGYEIQLGLPPPRQTLFGLDPEIKQETLFAGPVPRPASTLVQREGPVVQVRQGRGWKPLRSKLTGAESLLSFGGSEEEAPEVGALRRQLLQWRFYDHFRVDAGAPARQSPIGSFTPVLDNDGAHLAAAVQTIREIGDVEALDGAVAQAFEGAQLSVDSRDGLLSLVMRLPGLLRPLRVSEWSDGMLRYVLLVAVLLSPRPPQLLVLNEPESSLHPDLLPALGAWMRVAAQRTQMIVVTHNARLVASLTHAQPDEPTLSVAHIELLKSLGETRVL